MYMASNNLLIKMRKTSSVQEMTTVLRAITVLHASAGDAVADCNVSQTVRCTACNHASPLSALDASSTDAAPESRVCDN